MMTLIISSSTLHARYSIAVSASREIKNKAYGRNANKAQG